MNKFFYISLLTVLACGGCGKVLVTHTPPTTRMNERLDSLLTAPELANAIYGFSVYSLRTGRCLYEKNAQTSLMPASNLKLFTTATALKMLGPETRFTTLLRFNGVLQDSTFNGDLILTGGGDPTLLWVDSLGAVPQFVTLVEKLGAMGIKKINGRLMADDTFFDDVKYAPGWSWENEPFYFQPQISALSINNNCVDVIVTGGDSLGAPVKIDFVPPFPTIRIFSKMKTGNLTNIDVTRLAGSNTFVISGSVAPKRTARKTRTIDNPALCAVHLFAEELTAAGITFTTIEDIQYSDTDLVHTHSTADISVMSPPLADIITTINKKSDNLHAELLLKLVGKLTTGIGSSKAGAETMLNFWQSHGITIKNLNIVDGSGLSRKNLLTSDALANLLLQMRADSVFYNSLPIAGIDGTLEHPLWSAQANVRAKTGTLDYVKALSGYIRTAGGDELAFSFLVNHHLVETEKIIYIQNRLCRLLAEL